MYDEKLITNIK